MTAAQQALELVRSCSRIGLGTGRAATAFVEALGQAVAESSWKPRCVATSEVTARLATQLGIQVVELASIGELDVAVDGADEVDPQGDLIKGWGGALLREKVVACSARRFIVLVGSEKLVPALGSRGKLPVEVVPFAESFCLSEIQKLGFSAQTRQTTNGPYITDNGNRILDVAVRPTASAAELEQSLCRIPGVVDTGLFLQMATDLVIDQPDGRSEHRRYR